jgi:tetratricopeptide (TPR) repeat protein
VIDWGSKRPTQILALLVFIVVVAVYLITLTPTVPFWDAGEFIGVSYILGIPHPPGTPFYVILGRVATLIPWNSVAERVNALSAIPAALACMLTYLTLVKLIRMAFLGLEAPADRERWKAVARRGHAEGAASPPVDPAAEPGIETWKHVVTHIGAVVGALMLAFSDSFWENSIEAEVYALASCAQALVLWLGLRWWEAHERKPTSGPLLLAVYVMWLSVGLHLGVGIMGLPLLLLVALVDRRAALVFLMPLLSVLLVTMGLERMAGGILILSTIVFLAFSGQKKIPSIVAVAGALAALLPLGAAFTDSNFGWFTAALAVIAIALPLGFLAWRHREGRIILLALFLMAAGYSTHIYLPIRAAQRPAINEGAPATWNSLRDLLERKQYGEMNMFERRGTLESQLNKEFWRYFRRQWPVFPDPTRWGSILPLLLGIFGGAWLARRNGTGFLYAGSFLALTTVGMIVFLNFSDHEVRERDYFFQSGYHAYAILIGLGVAWSIAWVRDSFKPGPSRRWVTVLAGAALLAMPFILMRNLWHSHDRRGDYVARDYAYNMLAPLEPNSFIFTNGDNDTFPLWYMQEVEGFRKDVRVVNLSLLNTDWYIRQLRDEEPKVPIDLSDKEVELLGAGAIRDSAGNFIYTSQFMVGHIIGQNHKPDGSWIKQPYFAVTVPEHMGLDPYFSLEGLVHKVYTDSVTVAVNEPVTRKSLYETFLYRGLFTPDGSWDSTVFKDENAATLSRNYAAAHLQLAFYYRKLGQMDRAVSEMERVARMFPDFAEIMVPLGSFYMEQGDTARALALFERIAKRNPRDPEARYYYGVLLAYQGQADAAIAELEQVLRLDPSYAMAYYAAYHTLSEAQQPERALTYLERWVRANPSDEQARALLEQQRQGMGLSTPRPAPPPPTPSLP